MADRPIPFSDPMVAALLAGRKTQTRRILDPQPYDFPHPDTGNRIWNASGAVGGRICISDRGLLDLHRKPAPGDRLYVRETYYQFGHWEPVADAKTKGGKQKWGFVADEDEIRFDTPGDHVWCRLGRHHKDPATSAWHKRLGRFMPRAASRLTLIVESVKVERLQDISEADALAEGIDDRDAICGFSELWESINGTGAWDANPFVAAIGFRVIRANIDSEEASHD